MYDYIKGSIEILNPTELILENNGIGYCINISLQTYEYLQDKTNATIYIYHYLREDEELLYGFGTRDERELFKLLISVNGIGVTSARMMLSTLNDEEIRCAILAEDINTIKRVKGIGLKSAQRIILDLKDKIEKGAGNSSLENVLIGKSDTRIDEATSALVMLGFTKSNVQKVVTDITKSNPDLKVEEIIKLSLKRL